MAAPSLNAKRQIRVPFTSENKPNKPLIPIRCPFPDHDRGGMPLRFGLGQDKDAELRSRILKDMKLADINSIVDEASKVEVPPPTKPGEARKLKSNRDVVHSAAAGSDDGSGSLITAMAGRLRNAEQAAKELREEVRRKDAIIQQLRGDLNKAMRGEDTPRSAGEADLVMLKEHNAKLRELLRRADEEGKAAVKENEAMKKFLRDYGMTWVGSPPPDIKDVRKLSPQTNGSASAHTSDEDESSNGGAVPIKKNHITRSASAPDAVSGKKDFLMNGGNWQAPGTEGSVPDLNSQPGIESLGTEFDPAQILSNVKKLNYIAGEGQKEIAMGADGIRRLREKCTVSYTFYKNGVFARGGPLRPYNVRESKVLVRDLMDGYFPWELKDEYPEGVPLKVEMKLDETHGHDAPKQNFTAFKGEGVALGKGANKTDNEATITGVSEASRHEVWAPPAGKSLGHTLFRKLPERVIKNGNVINIREDIQQLVAGRVPAAAEAVCVESISETDALTPEDDAEPKAVLRVKTPDGDRVLELKMRYGETVGDLRKLIEPHLKTGVRYKIRSSFPAREYTDDSATLQDAGLTPNALLFLTLA